MWSRRWGCRSKLIPRYRQIIKLDTTAVGLGMGVHGNCRSWGMMMKRKTPRTIYTEGPGSPAQGRAVSCCMVSHPCSRQRILRMRMCLAATRSHFFNLYADRRDSIPNCFLKLRLLHSKLWNALEAPGRGLTPRLPTRRSITTPNINLVLFRETPLNILDLEAPAPGVNPLNSPGSTYGLHLRPPGSAGREPRPINTCRYGARSTGYRIR